MTIPVPHQCARLIDSDNAIIYDDKTSDWCLVKLHDNVAIQCGVKRCPCCKWVAPE